MATYKSPYSGRQVDNTVKNTSSLNFENGVLKVYSDIQLTEMGDESNSVATKSYVDEHGSATNIENGTGTSALIQKSTETGSSYTYNMDDVSKTVTFGATNKGSVALNGKSEASGSRAVSLGSGTAARGNQSIAFGAETIASGNGSVVGGYMSEATHEGSVVIGQHLKSNVLGGVVLGFYNDPNNGVEAGQANAGTGTGAGSGSGTTSSTANALFTIGNGSSNTDRQNIFQVYSDGTAYVRTTDGTNEAAVVNKQHLNAVINPLREDFQNQINNKLGLSGGLINGPLYLNSVSTENHVATKKYVDEVSTAGLPPAPDQVGEWSYVCKVTQTKRTDILSDYLPISQISASSFSCSANLPDKSITESYQIFILNFFVQNTSLMSSPLRSISIKIELDTGDITFPQGDGIVQDINYTVEDDIIFINGILKYAPSMATYHVQGLGSTETTIVGPINKEYYWKKNS